MKTQGKLRKHHSPEFKFKVALEALMGQKTIARGKKAHAPEPTEDIAYLQKTIGKLYDHIIINGVKVP
ncbi:MAG: hypothetical protein QG632_906 [Candidatus Dependentiae bacterium]|nr:hypothetical protein [Candidatus Dependentiae bacterium]